MRQHDVGSAQRVASTLGCPSPRRPSPLQRPSPHKGRHPTKAVTPAKAGVQNIPWNHPQILHFNDQTERCSGQAWDALGATHALPAPSDGAFGGIGMNDCGRGHASPAINHADAVVVGIAHAARVEENAGEEFLRKMPKNRMKLPEILEIMKDFVTNSRSCCRILLAHMPKRMCSDDSTRDPGTKGVGIIGSGLRMRSPYRHMASGVRARHGLAPTPRVCVPDTPA